MPTVTEYSYLISQLANSVLKEFYGNYFSLFQRVMNVRPLPVLMAVHVWMGWGNSHVSVSHNTQEKRANKVSNISLYQYGKQIID